MGYAMERYARDEDLMIMANDWRRYRKALSDHNVRQDAKSSTKRYVTWRLAKASPCDLFLTSLSRRVCICTSLV